MYKIIEYFKDEVYPTLSRAGLGGVNNFNTNCGLICEYLRQHYLKQLVEQGGYEDTEAPELWEAVNSICIEDISKEISFRDIDAQAPTRVLL